jgi:hypothetical protein
LTSLVSLDSTEPAEDTTMAIYPTPDQIQELLRGPADQPVVMVNLLRFVVAASNH